MISSLLGPPRASTPFSRGPGAADVAGEKGPWGADPRGPGSFAGPWCPRSRSSSLSRWAAPRPAVRCVRLPASAPQRPPLGRAVHPPLRLSRGRGGLSPLVTDLPSPSLRSASLYVRPPYRSQTLSPYSGGLPQRMPSWELVPRYLERCTKLSPLPLLGAFHLPCVVTTMPRES